MVKVNAPAMSLDASGSLGGAMVFSKWKGRNYVRSLVKPANPKSALQVAMRSMWKFTSQDWKNISSNDQADWNDLAEQGVYSPFNAYMSVNQDRWRNFLAPSQVYPVTASGSVGSFGSPSATAGVRQIEYEVSLNTVNSNWGLVIFRNTSTSPSAVLSEVIAVVLANTATTIKYVDTPLDPGTYFYDAVSFSTDGNYGSQLGAVNATVS